MNNIKTLEELFINDFFTLRAENEGLKSDVELLEAIEKNQNKSIEFWKNKYYELVNRLKEDIKPQIAVFPDGLSKHIEGNTLCIFEEYDDEKYEYYKEVFDLKEKEKEEGEE